MMLPLLADYLLPKSKGKLVITNLSTTALVEEIERAASVDAAAAALAARVKLLKGAAVTGMSRREPKP